MNDSAVQFAWREPRLAGAFDAGVCLHGHTLHSRECLSFLPRNLHCVPGVSQLVSYYERGHRRADFSRAWWTPPLTPASALGVEREQIARLGLRPMVSLTDHDDIEAGLALGVTAEPDDTPVSVEWTVPYERSIFHFGVHNLPRTAAREWLASMAEYTAAPRERALRVILDELARTPEALIVLNHPFWLEEGVASAEHRHALGLLVRECGAWIDAFELNGTRPWSENAATMDLAREIGHPLVSGGDRHGVEPAACINLTNALCFAEFAAEIRGDCGRILFLPQYREPMAQRILDVIHDILRAYPEYPGREHWFDRIYYQGEDGAPQTLAQLWRAHEARLLSGAAAAIRFAAGERFRPAWRALLAAGEEARL
jgi:hypothetical protein